MVRSPLFLRDKFQIKENNFALPEETRGLDPQTKRVLPICNLFVNHRLSISDIQQVLDDNCGHVMLTLISKGIVQDRRQIVGLGPGGSERRMPGTCGKT